MSVAKLSVMSRLSALTDESKAAERDARAEVA